MIISQPITESLEWRKEQQQRSDIPSGTQRDRSPHDPPGHIFEVTTVSFYKQAGTSLWGLYVFFVVVKISKLGLEPVQRHTWGHGVKWVEEWLFLTEKYLWKYAQSLLIKTHCSQRKVTILSILSEQRTHQILSFCLPAEAGLISNLIWPCSTVQCSSLHAHNSIM